MIPDKTTRLVLRQLGSESGASDMVLLSDSDGLPYSLVHCDIFYNRHDDERVLLTNLANGKTVTVELKIVNVE